MPSQAGDLVRSSLGLGPRLCFFQGDALYLLLLREKIPAQEQSTTDASSQNTNSFADFEHRILLCYSELKLP
jgi:hypothetical protein